MLNVERWALSQNCKKNLLRVLLLNKMVHVANDITPGLYIESYGRSILNSVCFILISEGFLELWFIFAKKRKIKQTKYEDLSNIPHPTNKRG